MATITTKQVQVHTSCNCCGYNSVEQEEMKIRYKDFKVAGIVRRKDTTTGKPFLFQRNVLTRCNPID